MTNMTGKTVLITGATNGIGKVAALEIARTGATVCLVARNQSRGEATLAEIKASTSNPNLELFVADLSSMAEVRKLASEFKAKHNRLDVLINNAGGYFDTRKTTADGLEYTFAFNHLAYFLLTDLLLDTLRASAPARIVNVASEAQAMGKMNFDDLQFEKRYGGFAAYGQSKLANIMFTYELARRLEGSGVTANVLHPGTVNTGFGSDTKNPVVNFVFGIVKRFSLTPTQGADTIIYLATSPEVEGVNGKYFEKRKPRSSSQISYDQNAQKRLWDESVRLTKIPS
jgi:NAD(P)-dependent dehydrogenase (short-subunit alcohol dehydrogenase family)